MSEVVREREAVHELAADGRERHYLVRVGDQWICECGETQDKYGH